MLANGSPPGACLQFQQHTDTHTPENSATLRQTLCRRRSSWPCPTFCRYVASRALEIRGTDGGIWHPYIRVYMINAVKLRVHCNVQCNGWTRSAYIPISIIMHNSGDQRAFHPRAPARQSERCVYACICVLPRATPLQTGAAVAARDMREYSECSELNCYAEVERMGDDVFNYRQTGFNQVWCDKFELAGRRRSERIQCGSNDVIWFLDILSMNWIVTRSSSLWIDLTGLTGTETGWLAESWAHLMTWNPIDNNHKW